MAYQSPWEQQIGTPVHPFEHWQGQRMRFVNGISDISQTVFDQNKTDFDWLNLILSDTKYWNDDLLYQSINDLLDTYGV